MKLISETPENPSDQALPGYAMKARISPAVPHSVLRLPVNFSPILVVLSISFALVIIRVAADIVYGIDISSVSVRD